MAFGKVTAADSTADLNRTGFQGSQCSSNLLQHPGAALQSQQGCLRKVHLFPHLQTLEFNESQTS